MIKVLVTYFSASGVTKKMAEKQKQKYSRDEGQKQPSGYC